MKKIHTFTKIEHVRYLVKIIVATDFEKLYKVQ